jgi:predicted MFS family arabinose efflux permease
MDDRKAVPGNPGLNGSPARNGTGTKHSPPVGRARPTRRETREGTAVREPDVVIENGGVVTDAEEGRRRPAIELPGHPARGPRALLPAAGSRGHHGLGFWAVAFTFMMLVAFTTVPSPLYAIYQARDGFSSFMLTVIFATYAVAAVSSLLLAGHLSDWFGRRRVLIPAGAFIVASGLVFVVWKSVPGLLVARALTGVAIGMTQGTATAYLQELHARHLPEAGPTRAQVAATTVNMGGLGVGALVAGLLAEWVADPLTVPYIVFLAVVLVALAAVALSPETRPAVRPRPRYRPQRVSLPQQARGEFYAAALSALMVFAVVGLFSGLAGLFLAVSLHHKSHALLGAVLFAAFAAGVVGQLVSISWSLRRELQAGMATMLLGLSAVVGAVWLSSPSLTLFIIGGAVSMAGAGTVFRGAIADVIRISPPEKRAEIVAAAYVASFIGLSIPIIGAGVALTEGVSPKVTLLGLAILIAAGLVLAATRLLGGAQPQTRRPTSLAQPEGAREVK